MLHQFARRIRFIIFPIVITTAISESRLQFLTVLFLCGVLSMGQGRELALSLEVSPGLSAIVGLAVVVAFSLQLWFWTNIAVLMGPWSQSAIRTGNSLARRVRRRSADVAATIYSSFLLLFVIIEFYRIGERAAALALCFANLLIFGYLVYKLSGDEDDQLLHALAQFSSMQPISRWVYAVGAKRWKSSVPLLAPAKVMLIYFSLIVSICAIFFWIIFQQPITHVVGSFGATFLCGLIILPWLSLLFAMTKGTHVPVVTAIVLLPFLAETIYGMIGIELERHTVRVLSGKDPGTVARMPPRPTIEAIADEWRSRNDKDGREAPMVFVSAAGGGIRAAYWTAAVLGRLQDCVPNFSDRVFSLSAVSGGSLGAVAFAALGAGPRPPQARGNCHYPLSDSQRTGIGGRQLFLRDFLSQDFLAPVIRQMFLGDGLHALFPWSSSGSDRGAILEIAWERAWQDACAQHHGECNSQLSMASPFSRLLSQERWIPALFLNGVHQETGKRLITSTAEIQNTTFIDAADFFDLVRYDLRLSTAVLNSARFPIVSPSGALLRYENNDESQKPIPVGHVIDGGYFDNNGSVTTHEAASTVLSHLGALRADSNACPSNRRVIFVEILNDTSIPHEDAIRSNAEYFTVINTDPRAISRLNTNLPARQLLTAIQGLETTRSAHAVYASKFLAKFAATETCHMKFVQFQVCPGLIPDPPLGWRL